MNAKNLTKIFGTVALAAIVAGCESSSEIARKPKLVEQILDQSMESCPTQMIANYDDHLSKALYDTWSEDLDFIIQNDVTICLDKRLDEDDLELGIFHRRPVSILYTSKNPILTLAFEDGEVTKYTGKMLDELRDEYEDQPAKLKNGPNQFGYTAVVKARHYYYKDAVDFSGYQNNPNIQVPPAKSGQEEPKQPSNPERDPVKRNSSRLRLAPRMNQNTP